MRKEIIGTVLFFLVVLTLVSLLSYNVEDPSFLHIGAEGKCRNLFGPLGAYLSSLLVALFGLGAFWIPIFLLIASVRFLGQKKEKNTLLFIAGAIILIITTGTFLSIISPSNSCVLLGKKISSGGMTIRLKEALMLYTNSTGSIIITLVLFTIGLILATGFSIVTSGRLVIKIAAEVKNTYFKFVAWVKEKNKVRKEKKKKIETVHDKARKNVKVEIIKKPEAEVKIVPAKVKPIKAAPVAKQEEFSFMSSGADKSYDIPSTTFLTDPEKSADSVNDESLRMQSMVLEKKLEDFGVHGHVSEIAPGPVITTFEYKPAAGVKITKIVNLSDDLALALRAISIRIIAPIPGKDAIGIEIPNDTRESVGFKEIVTSGVYVKSKSPLTLCLGNDIVGQPVVADLAKMPHLLIAGATGAGKSVGLNVMISSILFRATPDDVRMIMIDPKRIELSVYDGIPHLITPVVTDMKKATNALFWAVREMENRYELLADLKTRNITQYNKKVELLEKEPPSPESVDDENTMQHEKLPYVVIIIDELADLMMVSSKDVEVALMRLAQMARAAGIHIVLATQRPSVDVLTGIIKANFPTRISFQVSSRIDSRTIIDSNGAENLLGMGDMLFLPPGTAKLQRIHGAFISDDELNELIEFWKNQDGPGHDKSILETSTESQVGESSGGDDDYDEKYDEAVALVTKTGKASISSVQRYLKIGYNRAAGIIEAMERDGLIGPQEGSKPREIFLGTVDDLP